MVAGHELICTKCQSPNQQKKVQDQSIQERYRGKPRFSRAERSQRSEVVCDRSAVPRVQRCIIALFKPHEISRNEVRRIYCTQCGIPRLEVNHWFIAWTEKSGQQFCFTPMDSYPAMLTTDGVQTLCGQRCLHRAIQRFSDSIPKF